MTAITSHVLDTALGRPAMALDVRLDVLEQGEWRTLARATTNADGRVTGLVAAGELEARTYRLTFDTGAYHRARGQAGFYPSVDVVFQVEDPSAHYHVPLLLSPFGYSTYRGS